MDGIVNDVENHVAEHLADAAGGGGHSVGRRQDELRGEHEARHDRNDGGGEGAYQIEDDDRLDVEVFAGQVLVRNRTHHEHEHQNRGDGLKSRHKDGAEEAAADGCGGSRIGKRNAKYQTDDRPIEEGCQCPTCRRFSRAYLRHLFHAQELLAMQIASIHNLAFYLWLAGEARKHIIAGDFATWKPMMVKRVSTRL